VAEGRKNVGAVGEVWVKWGELAAEEEMSNYVIAPWRHGTAARPSTRASLG